MIDSYIENVSHISSEQHMTDRLLIIDANLYASRLYYDLCKETSITDISMVEEIIRERIIKVIRRHHASHVVCAYDISRSDYRTAIYPAYKRNRKPNKEREMFITFFRTVLGEMGICNLAIKGVEADDVIATVIANRERWFGYNIDTIVDSSDKDFRQLVSPTCQLFVREKKWHYTYPTFVNYYGFEPNRFPLFLALFGDMGDGITPVLIKEPLESKLDHLAGIFKLVSRCANVQEMLDWCWDHYADDEICRNVIHRAHKLERNYLLVTLLTDVDLGDISADRMSVNEIKAE